MEDISRELEREIARARPKPFRQNRKTKILIVDNFGEIKSGEHLKNLVKILSLLSIVCLFSSSIFYYLYSDLSGAEKSVQNRLILAEKKVDELTGEKEVLMARLVMLGKDPGVKKKDEKEDKTALFAVEEKKPLVSKNMEKKPVPSEPDAQESTATPEMVEAEKTNLLPGLAAEAPSLTASAQIAEPRIIKKTVSIEKFTVTKDGANKDLLVRFDIRNISTDPGDVSGRIFTVLKPDNGQDDQWLVVPASALKNGIPSENQKGQYFSIAHFKPVKFRIKNEASPDFFKKASIFIFNTDGDVIFEKLIDITESD